MTPHEYLKSLGTEKMPHSGKTFYEHLINVEQILRICRCKETVCLAGLFHSIYGTTFFLNRTVSNREEVKKIIGEKAEFLVWLFCNAQRPFCWFCGRHFVLRNGGSVLVDADTQHALQMIEGANLLEQQCKLDQIVSFATKGV